jgi:hypothetical protein
MILSAFLGTAMVVAVATGPTDEAGSGAKLSVQQKIAATQPLVRSATDCIVQAVVTNPRWAAGSVAELGDLIVDSMPSCASPVRAMIEAYDRYYGEGSGEAFFMGPYLDVLPRMVTEIGKKAGR